MDIAEEAATATNGAVAASARGGIVRAFDLAAASGPAPAGLAEPVHFIAPGLARHWPELRGPEAWIDPREVSPARWGPGENIWVVSTYLKLRRAGLDVRIGDRLVPDAVNVCYLDAAIRTPDSHRAFVVVTQGDRCYLDWGEFTMAQSPALAARPRTCLIDCWPQPGLLARDAARGTRIERIGYTGAPENLAAAFRSDAFRRDLEREGVELDVRSAPAQWHDFRDLDLHLAVRDLPRLMIRTKPPTKLVHSWIAGCPALLGPEPSYRHWGRDGSDYVEVRRPADVLAAVARFRADPELYLAVQDRGRKCAVGHDEDGVVRQWAAALAGPVRQEFDAWRRNAAQQDLRRRVRRRWQVLAAPASRKWFFLRANSWREIAGRMFGTPSGG